MSNLDRFWRGGSPLVLPIEGIPVCQLRLDQHLGHISLITEYQSPIPDLATLRNIDCHVVSDAAGDYAVIDVQVDDDVHGAYGLLTAIADDLQVHKAPLASAVAQAVARHKDMLAGRSSLTLEMEIGLFGELLFLEYLIQTIGAGPAIEAWQGPLREEHDFVFDDIDCEIKTTAGERRRHLISGLTQLVPSRVVPLALISIQVTRTGTSRGRTLPHLVTAVRGLAGGHRAVLDQRLSGLGWRDQDADLYRTFWCLRSEPRGYRVGCEFPAITAPALASVVPNFPAVSDVSYRVDLTELPHDSLPSPAGGFLEPKDL
ncbi:PD-(D/E)XK motif protein [Nocardia sp. NPDC005978]|uniref:PD-(D/E)XK motif protein n=1 Tax=Nocardia sp. NPDC005978 TaxID=3156725 RepID=UPI00339E2A51